MVHKRLSLCIIAKNEEENISRCIKSLIGLADETIVVDTGSLDHTREIALSLGAKVINIEWADNFSEARNISLENASSDWVLCLDCDEELGAESRPELDRVLDIEGPEAYFFQVVNTTAEGVELIVPGLRLFRNRKEYRFTGRIHEQIVANIAAHCQQNQIVQSNIRVYHFGYDKQIVNIPAKIQRNIKILENIPDDKKDGFYYYNLGTEYLRLGKLEDALAQFLIAAPLTHPGQGYGPIMIKRMITLLFDLGKYRQAQGYLEHYGNIYKDYTDLVLLTGVCHFMCGRYSEARDAIKKYLNLPPAPPRYPLESLAFNKSPHDLLESAARHAVEKDYPALSVCIIGNNEAATLATCIKSVNEISSQIVYVDTGSTDYSPVIARELGAEVHSLPWQYDFSYIRNYALEHAAGQWILVLDADEVLPEESVPAIVEAIKNKTNQAYLVRVHTPLDKNQSPQNWQLSGRIRLFCSGAYYQGVLADQLVFKESAINLQPVPEIALIHLHFQASSEQIAGKRKIWEEIISRNWPDNNSEKYFQLGKEAFYAQETQQALKYFKQSFEQGLKRESSAYYYYALSLINNGQYKEAVRVVQSAVEAFADYTDLFYLQGIAHGLLGELEAAEVILLKCLKMGETPWWKYLCSPGTGNYKALLSLGTVYVRQAKFQEAVSIFLQAAHIPESSEQAIEHLAILQAGNNISLDVLLKNQGLFNWRNSLIIAQSFAHIGKRAESWDYLQLLEEQAATDQTEYLRRLIGVVEAQLFNTKVQITNYTPEHPILEHV